MNKLLKRSEALFLVETFRLMGAELLHFNGNTYYMSLNDKVISVDTAFDKNAVEVGTPAFSERYIQNNSPREWVTVPTA